MQPDLLEWVYERTPATGSVGALAVRSGGVADCVGADVKTVPLHGKKAAGRVALVDDEDYELVMQYRWHVWEKVGRENKRDDGPYAQAPIRLQDGRKSTIRMHKLITGWPATDHANGDGLDNRRANLRPATKTQNLHNARSRSGTSSRFKGVSWHKVVRKWQANIKVDGKRCYLGVFASEEDAAAAYTAAALETQGEYAYARRQLELTLGPLGVVRDRPAEAGDDSQQQGEAA